MNKVVLMGNLGKDVDLRKTAGGTSVASFSLATTERFKGKDGAKQEKTQWHNITAWGKLADLCANHLRKGNKVLVSGKVEYRTYESGGVTKYATDIVIDEMHFLPNGASAPQPQGGTTYQNAPQSPALPQDDDLPF